MKDFFRQKPLVYLITEGKATRENYNEQSAQIAALAKVAVENKIPLIQIREKKLPAKLVYELTKKVLKIALGSRTKILVNDRADIAFAAKADGVHLTSNSLSPRTIRQHFPANFLIGVSTHTIEEAFLASEQKANFVVFSPIFNTPDKGAAKGLNLLEEVCEKLRSFPVIALGGINETNFKSILRTKAAGFAAIRFLNDAENIKKIAFQLNEKNEERS